MDERKKYGTFISHLWRIMGSSQNKQHRTLKWRWISFACLKHSYICSELDAKMAYLQTTQQFLLTKHVKQLCTKTIKILSVFMLLWQCCWGLCSSAICCLIIRWLMPNILRQHNNLIFKDWNVQAEFFMVLFLKVRHQSPNDTWCHSPEEQRHQCESHHYSLSKCSFNSVCKTWKAPIYFTGNCCYCQKGKDIYAWMSNIEIHDSITHKSYVMYKEQ